jgi:hypothetical protein
MSAVPHSVPDTARTKAPRWFRWLAWLGLAGYAAFLAVNTTVIAGGSDSSGYLNSARLLAAGKLHADMRVPPEFGVPAGASRRHFSPAGFNLFGSNPQLAPVYPTGLPLHLALGARLLGWSAGPYLMQLLASVGAVWLCYRVARELGVGYALAGAGAAVLAVFPVFIFTSIQTLSDTLATTWTLAAILCGLRARHASWWAAACGASLAVAVLVRPTSLVFAPALLVLLGIDLRRLALFAVSGLPGAAWFAWYNHRLYGGPLRSGYGDIYADFGLHYAVPTALHFAQWLGLMLPAALLALPFAALVHRHTRRREFVALALAAMGNIGLYLFYGVSHEVWWCLRFILPGVAVLILAGLLGVEALARGVGSRWPRAFRPTVALVLVVWAIGNSWYWTNRLHVLYVQKYEQAYADAAREVKARVPDNALVVCSLFSGALFYYTNLPVLVFDSIKADDFARYAALARGAGRPVYAVVFEVEEDDGLRTRCPGAWTRITAVGNIGIWRLQ